MSDPIFEGVVASIRAAARHALPVTIEPGHSFILDLGFDSLAIARLALSLEDRFRQPFLLDDWIADESDPAALDVDSLCRYLTETGGAHEPATV